MPGTIAPAPEVLFRHGPHTVTLRASLRVALALESLPGGIPKLWDEIARQKITPLHAVIRASATDRAEAERLIAHAAAHPLAHFAHCAQAACLALLASFLAPVQGEAEPSPPSTTATPLRDYYSDLYSYGTGWLGWPPSEVWNASPAEIEAAFLAYVDRLVKMTPGMVPTDTDKGAGVYTAERLRQIEEQGYDPAFDRAGLQRLKAKHT